MKKLSLILNLSVFTILLTSFFPENVFSQGIALQFAKNFGGTTGGNFYNYDAGSYVARTKDGGLISIGSTTSLDGNATGGGYHVGSIGTYDVWIIKADINGNIQWQKCYGGSGNDLGNSIIVANNGNYVFTAITNSNNGDVFGNHGIDDLWVVEIDSVGNIVWATTLGGNMSESNSVGATITQTLDNNFIVCAVTASNNTGNVSGYIGGSTDGWLVKLDSLGNFLGQKCIGTSSNNDFIRSVVSTKDSGYIVVGSIISNKFNSSGSWDIYISKFSKNGVVEWAKVYGASNTDFGWSIKQSSDGNYFISGSTKGGFVDYHGGVNDILVLMLNQNGDVVWQKTFGGNGDDYSCSLEITDDSNLMLSGSTTSNDGDMINGNQHGSYDAWVAKIDFSGNIITQRCIGGNKSDLGLNVIQVKPNTFVLVGQTQSSLTGDIGLNHLNYTNEFLLVKFIDNFSVSLPINLVSFNAKKVKENIELTWSTASEINNAYFSIERSIDGFYYQEIGRLSGAGNSNSVIHYSFFDNQPFNGVSYYRLTQVDYNGNSETFTPVAVDFTNDKKVFKTILYDYKGNEIIDKNNLSSGIYISITYDKDENIIERKKFFKQ